MEQIQTAFTGDLLELDKPNQSDLAFGQRRGERLARLARPETC